MKSILTWPGNKRRLIPQIQKAITNPYAHYVEPFLGSASVFLALHPETPATLADANPKLIRCLQDVKQHPDETSIHLAHLCPDKEQWISQYAVLRERLNTVSDFLPGEYAALFIWINHACFNGLWRVNKKGHFNVPPGDAYPALPSETEVKAFSDRMQHADILCQSYQETIRNAPPGSLIYCDPPYVAKSETANFTAYTAGGFTNADQIALCGLLVSRKQDCQILLSNHDIPLTHEIYSAEKGFTVAYSGAYRHTIGASAESRKSTKTSELILSI